MKVLLDTNIFLEYFQRRGQYQAVSQLFSAIENGSLDAVITTGSVYTLAYLIRVELKRMDIHRPEQTERLRQTLNTVLSLATVIDMNHKHIVLGVNDTTFDDVEDSFQHQCAVQNHCDAIVSINIRDFAGSRLPVLTPKDLAAQLNND
jgi:predicted nucleic acid-binding protein